MIKHRFIVRGADDFKIFAAIPCEKQVLTWKKWVRPPDWEALRALIDDAVTPTLMCVGEKLDLLQELTERALTAPAYQSVVADMSRHASLNLPGRASAAKGFRAALDPILAWLPTVGSEGGEEFSVVCDNLLNGMIKGGFAQMREAKESMTHWRRGVTSWVMAYRDQGNIPKAECAALIAATYDTGEHIGEDLELCMNELHTQIPLLLVPSSDPLPDTPCPPGTPFASYTIEFQGSIFSIVEGCAWVAARNLLKRFSKRSEDKAQRPGPDGVYPPTPSELWFKVDTVTLDKLSAEHTRGCHGISVADQDRLVEEMQTALLATDEEKRVVEIVTQMLVERGLNPKAPERIPVVEADPKHANQQREAERRDQQENRAPKVRTIKFHVSPPRYLREAAERIFASPSKHKRAHWVIGHWRNQAWGVQHKEHRQKWIKPHIRGLGEAGAVVARVAASDEEVAAIEPSSDAPPSPPPILH